MNIGLIELGPPCSAVRKQGTGSTKYEMISRTNDYDKQSGSYMRETDKESYSSGDYSNRGKVGHKNDYKASSTVRVGDKSGYTEYYKQEKVTRVDYDNTSSYYNSGGSSNSYNNYNSDGGSKSYNYISGGGSKSYKYNSGGGSKGYESYGGGQKYLD